MKIAFALLAAAGVAASANAGITATYEEIGEAVGPAAPTGVYSSLAAPTTGYTAFGLAAGANGFDDYTSTQASPFSLAQFKFVGGVGAAGNSMRFDFYTPAAVLFSSFTIALPQAGFFIWTITFGTLPDGSDSIFTIPEAGIVEATTTVGTGRFAFTAFAPSIGANNVAFGTGSTLNPQRYNAFELVMAPTPGSLALLGLGGLAAARRRR